MGQGGLGGMWQKQQVKLRGRSDPWEEGTEEAGSGAGRRLGATLADRGGSWKEGQSRVDDCLVGAAPWAWGAK